MVPKTNKIKFYDTVSHRSYYIERKDVDLKRTNRSDCIIIKGESVKDTPNRSGVIFATKKAVNMVRHTKRKDWK